MEDDLDDVNSTPSSLLTTIPSHRSVRSCGPVILVESAQLRIVHLGSPRYEPEKLREAGRGEIHLDLELLKYT